jgi:hypothetical protein
MCFFSFYLIDKYKANISTMIEGRKVNAEGEREKNGKWK